MRNGKNFVRLWTTGITLKYGHSGSDKFGWWARVDFENYIVPCNSEAMSGSISTEYAIPIDEAIDQVIELSKAIGIDFFDHPQISPMLYYLNDGESKDYPPPDGWRDILSDQAKRIGFISYKQRLANEDTTQNN